MKIEHIYTRLICGGIGYAPTLYRINRKYFTIRGDVAPDDIRKIAGKYGGKNKSNGYSLWRKHKFDNEITATDFLKIIKAKGD